MCQNWSGRYSASAMNGLLIDELRFSDEVDHTHTPTVQRRTGTRVNYNQPLWAFTFDCEQWPRRVSLFPIMFASLAMILSSAYSSAHRKPSSCMSLAAMWTALRQCTLHRVSKLIYHHIVFASTALTICSYGLDVWTFVIFVAVHRAKI